MKTLLASLVVILGWSPLAIGQQACANSPWTDQWSTSTMNSIAAIRSSSSRRSVYDYTYVAPSAEALIRIAQIRPEQMPGALDA